MEPNRIFIAALACAGLLMSSAHAAGDAAAGKQKSAACQGCHGADGNSLVPTFPSLAGQVPNYLIKQTKDFRDGKRSNDTMSPMAAGLSDADIADIAAYFAAQKPVATGHEEDKGLVAMGNKIFKGGDKGNNLAACAGCHSPGARGNNAAKFPLLAGQQPEYTRTQLLSFRAGERSNDPNKMMQDVASRMSDNGIKAVAAYLGTLQRADQESER